MLPNRKVPGREKYGRPKGTDHCVINSVLSAPLPLPLGNQPSLTPCSSNGTGSQRLVQGLGLWPKQGQSVNLPESGMRMLKESSNISTGVAKLIRESKIPTANLSNSRKTFIYKSSEWGQPTEGRKGERWGPERAMMISFAPLEPTVTKPGKLLDFTVTWANTFPFLLEFVWVGSFETKRMLTYDT